MPKEIGLGETAATETRRHADTFDGRIGKGVARMSGSGGIKIPDLLKRAAAESETQQG